MITREDRAEFARGVKQGAERFFIALSAPAQTDILFPFWSEAIHRIMIRHGCSCANGCELNCFGVLTRDAQIAVMESNRELSFENFLSLFDEARAVLLTGTPPSKTNIDTCA